LWIPRLRLWRNGPNPITLADRARDKGEWELAARHYREALHLNPNNLPVWTQYGHVMKEWGHAAEAEGAYRKAIELDPNAADIHLQLHDALKIQGKTDEAAAAYRRALALDPTLHADLQPLDPASRAFCQH
jgi:tetratricopeptide (TPR) repeat protein